MSTRREILVTTIAAAAAAPLALSQVHHESPSDGPAPKRAAKFFNKKELALLTRLTDLIIPRTATPGAADAGVPFYIDWQSHTNAKLGASVRSSLKWVNSTTGSRFLKLNEAAQVALLEKWEQSTGSESNQVFRQIKDLTIDGYYGTREGLQVELGWNANTFLKEFKGCS